MRTHMLVAVGSALFYAAGVLILDEASVPVLTGDVLRVPAVQPLDGRIHSTADMLMLRHRLEAV